MYHIKNITGALEANIREVSGQSSVEKAENGLQSASSQGIYNIAIITFDIECIHILQLKHFFKKKISSTKGNF